MKSEPFEAGIKCPASKRKCHIGHKDTDYENNTPSAHPFPKMKLCHSYLALLLQRPTKSRINGHVTYKYKAPGEL